MLTLEYISDRLEIQDLLVRYAHAIDFADWDELDRVFTPDAVIDYAAFGGPIGDLASTKAFLRAAMPATASSQHMVATSLVEIAGDEATGRTICHNPMAWQPRTPGAVRDITIYGLWYVDRFVRTSARPHVRRLAHRCAT